jgi:hypothetical protein
VREEINRHRRRFFGTVAMTVAAAGLGLTGAANAQAGKAKPEDLPRIKAGTNTSFSLLKTISAGLLNIKRFSLGGAAHRSPRRGSAIGIRAGK